MFLRSLEHNTSEGLHWYHISKLLINPQILSHTMATFKYLVVAVVAISGISQATPIPDGNLDILSGLDASLDKRSLFSVDGVIESSINKRTIFNVGDLNDKAQEDALKQAQKDAVAVAAMALDKMDSEAHKDKLTRWFGEWPETHDKVEKVLKNFVGDNKDGEGARVLGDVKVWKDDYWKIKGTPFCDITTPDGKTGTAYYKEKSGDPGMHYCPKFFDRKKASDYIRDDCSHIANHIDTTTITRAFQGANVLHEFM